MFEMGNGDTGGNCTGNGMADESEELVSII